MRSEWTTYTTCVVQEHKETVETIMYCVVSGPAECQEKVLIDLKWAN